jgi:tetratricopeptide (TPR) repeat protein
MHDIKALEEEWKRYKLKQARPWYIVGGIFLLSMLLVFGISYKYSLPKLPAFDFSFKAPMIDKISEEKIIINPPLLTLDEYRESMRQDKVNKDDDLLVDLPILDTENQSDSVNKENSGKKKIDLKIIETSEEEAYKDVEKRFLLSHNVDDALFLAKSYYKYGKYKKAEHWAYETNKIDADNTESLFIFIKAKVKLGKRNEALSILRSYIAQTGSSDAKILLSDIENNKL